MKHFPGILANDNVDFSARQGEIHALIGENGAGKSTLMKILYGVYQPDSGYIMIKGESVSISSPHDAISYGIGMVHQKFMLVQAFTALENIILGQEPSSLGHIDIRKAEKVVHDICTRMSLDVNLNSRISDMSVSSMQKVEILKALYRNAEILIMDEPASILAPKEAESLFDMLRHMASEGLCVILISHKLSDVMAYSDRITVLRQGKLAAAMKTGETTVDVLTRRMIGADKEMQQDHANLHHTENKPVLEVHNLSVKGNSGNTPVDSVSFTINSGDLVGIAGVDGNGQQELVEALMGLRSSSGSIVYDGNDMSKTTTAYRIDSGLSYIPENPEDAIAAILSIHENSILGYHRNPPFTRHGMIDIQASKQHSDSLIDDYAIAASDIDMQAKNLSGGNLQKLIVGRVLSMKPRVLIAAQPTRGLDVNAAADIHHRFIKAASEGMAILVISNDLDEILKICTKVMVIYKGQIARTFSIEEATKESIGSYMVGASE
ncbi:MAG: ABC transporter ATP-binding protein [Armatimonadota bacterium]